MIISKVKLLVARLTRLAACFVAASGARSTPQNNRGISLRSSGRASRLIQTRKSWVVIILILGGAPAFADDVQNIASGVQTAAWDSVALDTVWTLLAGMLVMFMQAGFAMVEAGFTRAKNACNVLMKNLMDFCVGSIIYWAVGFGIMFGAGNAFFGTGGFFLHDAGGTFASLDWSSVPLECKYFFQMVFAATAATIVSGTMAERTKFVAYLIYSVVISAVIYPVVGHWIWGGGWLAGLGMWDFAGSTVVHSTGAWVALMGAVMLGPRYGKYNKDGSSNAIPGHNIPLAALGVFILWFGWYGFNPGSTMAAVPSIAHIATTTTLAAGAGAVAAMLMAWKLFEKPDVSMTLNGTLAGLVSVTAPCAFISGASALIIGFMAGILVVLSVVFIDKVLHIDDPVGAISVHGVCGTWGTLSLGFFAQDVFSPGTTGNGLLFGGGAKLLIAQCIGVASVFTWCLLTGFILFFVIKSTIGLRVTREEELKGLDIGEHGMESYAGFQIFTAE
jgi:Amt family ammonium transporter